MCSDKLGLNRLVQRTLALLYLYVLKPDCQRLSDDDIGGKKMFLAPHEFVFYYNKNLVQVIFVQHCVGHALFGPVQNCFIDFLPHSECKKSRNQSLFLSLMKKENGLHCLCTSNPAKSFQILKKSSYLAILDINGVYTFFFSKL